MSKNELFSRCDFHIHTHLSECALDQMRAPAILDACKRRGITRLGITDHINPSTDASILDVDREELDALDTSVETYLGCEAEILSVGKHTVNDGMKQSLDYVAIAANHFQGPWVEQPPDNTAFGIACHHLDMFAYACSLDFVDMIVHPMCDVAGVHDTTGFEALTEADLTPPLVEARKNGIAVEISPRALVTEGMPFRLRFYSLCRRLGLKFAFGSDAHALRNVGQTQVLADLVSRIGITDSDVWLPDGGKYSVRDQES
jgi:histidinol phosphatase-like PHP family hydrolase